MNNIKKERTLQPLALMATVVFAALTLFCLLVFLSFVFTENATDNMLMWLCFVCLAPAFGFYYAFSHSVHFTKKLYCITISTIACVVMDIIYIIVVMCVKNSMTNSLGFFGVDPAVTCIIAVFAGQLSYFALFLMLCKSGKKLHEFLCILLSLIVPFLAFGLAVIILIAVLGLLVYAFMKGFVSFSKAIGAGQPQQRNTYTVNDGGRTYTLTYYQRNLVHNADEYRDEYNQAWITDDGGRTFARI